MAARGASETDPDQMDSIGIAETLQLEDKASFRHQSAAFKQVLDHSTKFRRSLPEPSGDKPGRLKQIAAWGESQDDTCTRGDGSRKLIVYDRPLKRDKGAAVAQGAGFSTPRIEGRGHLTESWHVEPTKRPPDTERRPTC